MRRIPGQPAFGEPAFPRWLNGDLTLACGKHLHDLCKGTISTIGIECPCLCACHASESTPMPADHIAATLGQSEKGRQR